MNQESNQEADEHYAELAEAFMRKMDAVGPIAPLEHNALQVVIARLRRYSLAAAQQLSPIVERIEREKEVLLVKWQAREDRLDVDSEVVGIEPSQQDFLRGYSEGTMHCKEELRASLTRTASEVSK